MSETRKLSDVFQAVSDALVAFVVRYHGRPTALRVDLRPEEPTPAHEVLVNRYAESVRALGIELHNAEQPCEDDDLREAVAQHALAKLALSKAEADLGAAFASAADHLDAQCGGEVDVYDIGVPVKAASLRLEGSVVAALPPNRIAELAELYAEVADRARSRKL